MNFLGDGNTFLVIISDELSPEETEKLLNLLKKYKKVIGYSINDLKGISPAFAHIVYNSRSNTSQS